MRLWTLIFGTFSARYWVDFSLQYTSILSIPDTKFYFYIWCFCETCSSLFDFYSKLSSSYFESPTSKYTTTFSTPNKLNSISVSIIILHSCCQTHVIFQPPNFLVFRQNLFLKNRFFFITFQASTNTKLANLPEQ